MITTVIGAAIIYYFKLEWWWWLLLALATAMEINQSVSDNTNLANTVNKLNDMENQLYSINETLEKIEDNTEKPKNYDY